MPPDCCITHPVRPYRPWGNLRPHNPIIEGGVPNLPFLIGYRSKAIRLTPSNGKNNAVELIHPSVLMQDFDGAPDLWPNDIRTILAYVRRGTPAVAILDPLEIELRDVAFKKVRADGKGPLLDYGVFGDMQSG